MTYLFYPRYVETDQIFRKIALDKIRMKYRGGATATPINKNVGKNSKLLKLYKKSTNTKVKLKAAGNKNRSEEKKPSVKKAIKTPSVSQDDMEDTLEEEEEG